MASPAHFQPIRINSLCCNISSLHNIRQEKEVKPHDAIVIGFDCDIRIEQQSTDSSHLKTFTQIFTFTTNIHL